MGLEAIDFAHCRDNRSLPRCRRVSRSPTTLRHPVRVGHRLRCAIDGYGTGIVQLIGESYGQHTVQTAWGEFNIGLGEAFHGYHVNAELFYSWLFHRWAPARERGHEVRDEALYGVPPTRAYLDRLSSSVNPLLRLYLEGCLATVARFYEVLDCDAGSGFHARDVFTGSVSIVSEALASTSLERGDIFYAHLIPIGQITLMEAISPCSFPPQSKSRLLQLRPQQRNHAQDSEGPELRRIYFSLSAL